MIVFGEATDAIGHELVTTDWDHDPDDPFAVFVEFPAQGFTWLFSLETMREAMASPWEMYGEGDVTMALGDTEFLVCLRTSAAPPVVIGFPAADVRTFLTEVDDSYASEVVSDAIAEFLEEIND